MTGRTVFERLLLAGSVAATGGIAVGKASRSGPGSAPSVLLIVGLSAFVAAGCASTKSIPTSSDAGITKDEVTAKGGATVCAAGLEATYNPDGSLLSIKCQVSGALTSPPTPEETTALGKFGDSLLEVVRLPLDALAAIGRALVAAPAVASAAP